MVNGRLLGQYVEVAKLRWNAREVSSSWSVFGMLFSISNFLSAADSH